MGGVGGRGGSHRRRAQRPRALDGVGGGGARAFRCGNLLVNAKLPNSNFSTNATQMASSVDANALPLKRLSKQTLRIDLAHGTNSYSCLTMKQFDKRAALAVQSTRRQPLLNRVRHQMNSPEVLVRVGVRLRGLGCAGVDPRSRDFRSSELQQHCAHLEAAATHRRRQLAAASRERSSFVPAPGPAPAPAREASPPAPAPTFWPQRLEPALTVTCRSTLPPKKRKY